MKKLYNSPDMEIIRYTLVDVLSNSPVEGDDGVNSQYNELDPGDITGDELGDL